MIMVCGKCLRLSGRIEKLEGEKKILKPHSKGLMADTNVHFVARVSCSDSGLANLGSQTLNYYITHDGSGTECFYCSEV